MDGIFGLALSKFAFSKIILLASIMIVFISKNVTFIPPKLLKLDLGKSINANSVVELTLAHKVDVMAVISIRLPTFVLVLYAST